MIQYSTFKVYDISAPLSTVPKPVFKEICSEIGRWNNLRQKQHCKVRENTTFQLVANLRIVAGSLSLVTSNE